MKHMYLVCLYQTMYIFSTYIHILYINIGLFRNVNTQHCVAVSIVSTQNCSCRNKGNKSQYYDVSSLIFFLFIQ